MARTPGSAVFDRELAELRLLDALVSNYEAFAAVAIAGSLAVVDLVYLQEEWTTLVLEPTMETAVEEGFEDVAAAYFGELGLVFDVADTLTAVRDYATTKGLTKRATRNLMRDAIKVDARTLEPVPAELMTVGAKGSPRLAVKGLPFVERGMSNRHRFEAVARTLATGMDGWAARKQAQKTGDHLRWVTMQDDKVRPAHVHAQGQTVPPDEPFMVGGWPMWYPGDPDAPEDLTVNCRCVLASIEPDPNRRYVQRYVPSEWLNAAGGLPGMNSPGQARAPKGTSIGGQWIDTPGAILRSVNRLEKGSDLGTDMRPVDEMTAYRRQRAAEILEREGRPSLEESAERIREFHSLTTEDQIAKGDVWYEEGHDLVREMVANPNTDLTEEQAAAIIAHLSTQTRWEANAEYARAFADGKTQDEALAILKGKIAAGLVPRAKQGGEFPLDDNWNKALKAASSGDPIGRLDGLGTFSEANKTRTFASNLLGDMDGVTIDSHMERALGQRIRPTVGTQLKDDAGKIISQKLREDQIYESLSEAVRIVAEEEGVSPAVMQARVWGWALSAEVDARTGHPGRLVDPVTHEVFPQVIGGEQALIESGDLVVASGLPGIGEPSIADEPMPDYWYAQAERLLGYPREVAPELVREGLTEEPVSSLDVPVEFEEVGWFDPASLTAAGAPTQARAPKGTRIGGQWIDTPSAILNALGLPGEGPDAPAVRYDVPVVTPGTVIPGRGPERKVMVEAEAAELDVSMPPPPVPPAPVVEAVVAYTDGRVAAVLNGGLRKPPPPAEYDEMIKNLDAAIASEACPEDMFVYRLVPRHLLPHPTSPYEGLDDPKSVVGKVIADKGYLSTSIDPLASGDYTSKTLIRIAVPKGHPVAWVKPFSQNPNENEMLLGRETALAITAIGTDDWGDPVYEAVIAYSAEVSVSASLTAAAPTQARAPRGTPIGGEWIDTPGGLLSGMQAVVAEQGGASIDPLTGLQPTTGYMVATQGNNREVPEDEFFGPAGEDALHSWIAEHQEQLSQPGAHIGLWHDTANREVVLDVSEQVEDLDEAIRLGEERNQQAVWDVANGTEIDTGGTGDRAIAAAATDPTGPADEHRPPRGLLRVGRGAPARVRESGDHGAQSAGVTFASADQVRAPKGTPQGGQWIDTPAGLARQLRGVNLAVDNLGKPVAEPVSLDDMDNDYTTLVEQVNPGYLNDPNDPAYNMNCQRVCGAVEMRARGFDAAANAFDGTRDDVIAIENMWNDPQTGSVRLFSTELPPNQAIKMIEQYPPGSRFIINGWSEGEQFGHVWNGELRSDGTLLEVDGQGGTNMGESIHDMFDEVQFLRVDDLTPTEEMLGYVGGMYPMVTTPDNQRQRVGTGLTGAAPPDPVEAGRAAGFEVIEVRDLGSVYHLIVANPVHKFSDSILVMEKGTGAVGYVSRFTHPAVQTTPEEDTMASRFAEPPTVTIVTPPPAPTFAFSPAQARAPKGTTIGGQWLETARALLDKVKGPPAGGAPGPLVESTGPQVLRTEKGLYKEFEPTTTGDDEGVPDIRNDEGMDHTDLKSGATDPKGRAYGDDVIQRANEIHTQAIVAEPKLTEDMRAAMQGSGGELGGLEYRIKNQGSLAKKIRGNVEEGKPFETQNVTDNIKDSVRYTAIFDEGDYVGGTQTAISRLREKGYQVDVKSFYVGEEAGLAYKGVHGQAISPEGFKVELQFHTPASLEAKFSPQMHKVYDAQKLVPKGSEEWESYEQEMRDYMTSIGYTSPPGAETIA